MATVTDAQDTFSSGTYLVGHTADIGGTWTRSNTTGNRFVTAGTVSGDGSGSTDSRFFRLGTGLIGDGDAYLTWRGAGGGVAIMFRTIDNANFYEIELANSSEGSSFTLYRCTAGSTTIIASVGGLPGDDAPYRFRVNVSGSSPTAIKARFWAESGSEGTSWAIDTTDNTTGNQVASGGFGLTVASSNIGYHGVADNFLVTHEGSDALQRMLIGMP